MRELVFGEGTDVNWAIANRIWVSEHICCCERNGGERCPTEGVVSCAVDAGVAVGNVKACGAFHEPCVIISTPNKIIGSFTNWRLLHISKNGPPFKLVQAILPCVPRSCKYSRILTFAPTKASGSLLYCSRVMCPTYSFANNNLTPAATAASMMSFEGSYWVLPPVTQFTTASWPVKASDREEKEE